MYSQFRTLVGCVIACVAAASLPTSAADKPATARPMAVRHRATGNPGVAADFARTKSGAWYFLEAGAGSCSGTAHEAVFKAIAQELMHRPMNLTGDAVGGGFDS